MKVFTKEEIEEVLEANIKSILELDSEIVINSFDFNDHGMDSMNTITLIITLEEIFGIEYEDEELSYLNFNKLNVITENIIQKISLKRNGESQ